MCKKAFVHRILTSIMILEKYHKAKMNIASKEQQQFVRQSPIL